MPDFSLHHNGESLPAGVYAFPSCPPLSLLRASIEELLPSEIASDVSGHIDTCLLCQMLLTDLETISPASLTPKGRERIRRNLPVAPPPHKHDWYWYPAALAAIALVVAGLSLLVHLPASEAASSRAPLPQPPAAQPEELPSAIAKLAPVSDLSAAPAAHGASSVVQPTAQQLAPAFDAYSQSDYPLAARRFKLLADQFPRSETPFLYLGITQLLQHDNNAALRNLTRADSLARQNHGTQRNDAAWYHAFAALEAHSTDAPDLLENICTLKNSPYSQQACELETTTSK